MLAFLASGALGEPQEGTNTAHNTSRTPSQAAGTTFHRRHPKGSVERSARRGADEGRIQGDPVLVECLLGDPAREHDAGRN